uniref:GCC2 and GCC3 domain-containing protein n=2 Tax=Toxoplasma gondii TaxID=5811 RepID=A0A2T6IYG4_TOXGO|nr:GCC2 and GCC3 domain-containing protein [Toxoplasma gondii TgCATBr9]
MSSLASDANNSSSAADIVHDFCTKICDPVSVSSFAEVGGSPRSSDASSRPLGKALRKSRLVGFFLVPVFVVFFVLSSDATSSTRGVGVLSARADREEKSSVSSSSRASSSPGASALLVQTTYAENPYRDTKAAGYTGRSSRRSARARRRRAADGGEGKGFLGDMLNKSMLETRSRSTAADPYQQFTSCGSGMFVSTEVGEDGGVEKTAKVDESMNCWNVCAFVEDLVYDQCSSTPSPTECITRALKSHSLVPDGYKGNCRYSSPQDVSPTFWDAEPDSEFCLDKGMNAWLKSDSWDDFVSKKPPGCIYPKQDPSIPASTPTAYVNDATSGLGEALASLVPVEYYVVVRDAEEAMNNPIEYGAYVASSIVPREYWDKVSSDAKDGWHVARAFSVPDKPAEFAALTTAADGSSTSANICLYAAVETANHSDGTSKTFVNYGMIAQTETCEGKIGVLPVADIRGSGILDSSAQEISRKTGFNLCVARRWVTRHLSENGIKSTAQVPMFQVALDAPCASFVSAYAYTDEVPSHWGQWEQYFVAKTYPLTRGIYGIPDAARCPWSYAVQYGLKCYTSIEYDFYMYLGSFAEGQIACRRLVSNIQVPSDFSRLAVMQTDDDEKIMTFLSEPGTFTWVGLFQGSQALLPVKTGFMDSGRVSEQTCPAEVLATGQFSHRNSEIEEKCLQAGANISTPGWKTTWGGLDGNSEIAPWDIKWCSGHPQTERNNRYVDCAGLRVNDNMESCIESAPCDEANPVFCTYPVDYGPYLETTTPQGQSSTGPRLPPYIGCLLRKTCVIQFTLTRPDTSSDTTLPGAHGTIWGVPSEGGFLAVKANCMAVNGPMIGPYRVTSTVNLASLAAFRSARPGLYELCYCNTNSPAVSVVTTGATPDTQCMHQSSFNQLIASLGLTKYNENVGFSQAVQLPTASATVSTKSVLALVGRDSWGGVPTVYCGWQSTGRSCPFDVRVTSNGSWKLRPFTTKLTFYPVDSSVLVTDLCTSEESPAIVVSVTIQSGDTGSAILDAENATSLFYSVCEGKKFLGYVVLKEIGNAVEAKISLENVVLSDQTNVNADDVTLILRGEFTDALLLRSKVVAVSVESATDSDCSTLTLASLPESSVTIVPFPTLSSGTGDLVELHFKAGPSAKKLCWMETIAMGADRDSRTFSTYLVTFPRASTVRELSVEDSRCFGPSDHPCRFRVTPEPVPSEENPINASPYLPSTFRVYVMKDGCPSSAEDSVLDEIDNSSGADPVAANAKGILLELEWESESAMQAVLQPQYFPWLQAIGSANLCWVYTRGNAETECPIGSTSCGDTFGKMYAVGPTSDVQANVVVCLPGAPEPCLTTVEGVNLNLYERITDRMAALDTCGSDTGIGLLTPWGHYAGLIGSSLSALEDGVLRSRSGPSHPSSVSQPSPSFALLGQGLSQTKASFHGSDGRSRGSKSLMWSFATDSDLTDPSSGNTPSNATSLVFQIPFASEGGSLELCFRTGESDSDDLTRFTEPVGHVVYGWRLHGATLAVEATTNPNAVFYRVTVVSGIDAAGALSSTVVYLKPVKGYPEGTTVPCDYDLDTSGDVAHQVQGPVVSSDVDDVTWDDDLGGTSSRGSSASFKIPLLHYQGMAVCWSQLVEASPAQGSHSQSPFSVRSATLVGYFAGPSLPVLAENSDVAVACALAKTTCEIAVGPGRAAVDYTGGLAITPAFLDVRVTVVLDAELLAAPCPDPSDPGYENAIRATSQTRLVLPSDVLTPERQTFLVDSNARELLKTNGKAGICYRVDNCATESDAPTSDCTKFLGLALWVGPTAETPDKVTICKAQQRDCLLRIDGSNMDVVDYSAPRAAYAATCGEPGQYVTATLVQTSSTPSQETLDSDLVSNEHASWAAFAFAIQPASLWRLCWNPFDAATMQDEPAEDRFVVNRGFLVFPATPEVESERVELDSSSQTMLRLVISAMVTEAALEKVSRPDTPVTEHYVYVSPVLSHANGVAEDVVCADADEETKVQWTSVDAKTPTAFGNEDSNDAATASRIHYSITAISVEQQVCWRSVYRAEDGTVVHEERIYLSKVPAVLTPELDTSVANQVSPLLTFCSLGTEEMCLVTLKPRASSDSTPATFPPGGELYVVHEGDCPSERADPKLVNAAGDGVPTTDTTVVRLHVVTFDTTRVALGFPEDDRTWMSARKAAALCFVFGENQCPASGACVERIGMIYWRGPRVFEDTQLRVLCNDPQGCDISVTGLNLNTYDLSYSRVAALDSCGEPGGLGRLDIVRYPAGYTQDSPVEPLDDYFTSDDSFGQGSFAINNMGRGVLTCGASEAVSVTTASWGPADLQNSKVACDPVDVLEHVAAHCEGKAICVVYPHTPRDDETVRSYIGLKQEEFLRLSDPCPGTANEDLRLVGTHTCVAGTRSVTPEVAMVETTSRVAAGGANYSNPSTDAMDMVVKLPPDIAKVYELCWNPDPVITLQPARYNVKVGVAQIVPVAGLVDLISTVFERIDDANVEVVLRGILAEEVAVNTSIYLKQIPDEGAISCSNDDQENAIGKATFMSYESGDAGTTVIRYRIAAVDSEKAVCWRWTSQDFAAGGGGVQSILIGTLPGTVNPVSRAWGEMMCSLPGGTDCSIEFEPDSLLGTYPTEEEPGSGAVTGFTDYAQFANLHSHLRKGTKIGLIAGRESCPEDPQDLAYQRFTQTGIAEGDISDSEVQETTIGLPISGGKPSSLVSTMSVGLLHWLAVHKDAIVCWVNADECKTTKTPRFATCTATVGTLSWKGPIPTEWSVTAVDLVCRTGGRCRLKIPGRNMFKLDLSESPVAIVRTCGGDEGPGIAKLQQTPVLYPSQQADDGVQSGSLLQTTMSLSSNQRRAVRQLRRSCKMGSEDHADRCDTRLATGNTAMGFAAGSRRHPSFMEVLLGSRKAPSSSVDDSIEVVTTIKTGGEYAICWNPSALSTNLSDFTVNIGRVFSYGLEQIDALCYSGSYCELNFTYIGSSNPTLFVGVKAVDCSDPDLTTELGSGGVFKTTGRNTISLSEPIPRRPQSSRVSYKLCWCDMNEVQECVGTSYSAPVGTLTVQFIEEKAVACQEAVGACSISFDASDFQGDSSGTIFLTQYSGTNADCMQPKKYVPHVSAIFGNIVVQVDQATLAATLGQHAAEQGSFAICRQMTAAIDEYTGSSNAVPEADENQVESAEPEQNAEGETPEQGAEEAGGNAAEPGAESGTQEGAVTPGVEPDGGEPVAPEVDSGGGESVAPGVDSGGGDSVAPGVDSGGGDSVAPGVDSGSGVAGTASEGVDEQSDLTTSQPEDLEAKSQTALGMVQLDDTGSDTSLQVTSSPALLGVLQFAGPASTEYQDETQVAVLGMATRIAVVTQGFDRFIDTDITADSSDIPTGVAHVRLVPAGGCGHDNGSNSVVLSLSQVIQKESDLPEKAIYSQEEILQINTGAIRKLDVCWCDLGTACKKDTDFTIPVLSVGLVAPEQDLVVKCPCGSKCPFEFQGVSEAPQHGVEPDYFVKNDGCSGAPAELPDQGHLVTVVSSVIAAEHSDDAVADVDRSPAGELETLNKQIQAFRAEVDRTSVFASGTTEGSREYAICYCAFRTGGCANDALIRIGTLTVYDVWRDKMSAVVADDVTIRPPSPPFSGIQGTLYAQAGAVTLPVSTLPDKAYQIDLSTLEGRRTPASVVDVRYCESEVTQSCDDEGAPRIDLTQIELKGPVSLSFEDECRLGFRCTIVTEVFNPTEEEKLAALASCGSSSEHDYGLSSGVRTAEDNPAKAVEVTFEWEKTLPDVGRSELDFCWCKKTNQVDCSAVDQYTLKVGTLYITGLAAGQEATCHVGSVCVAHLKGYRLVEEVVNVRVVAGECGTAGSEISGLPNGGIFVPEQVAESSAEVSLIEPFFGLAVETAAICQCPMPTQACESEADYAWEAGRYIFSGPSERVVINALSGQGVEVEIPWRGEQDTASDFFILTRDTMCSGTTSGLIDGVVDNGLGHLEDGEVAWEEFAYHGGIYSVCYCRRSTPLATGSANPFSGGSASASQHLCGTVAEYRVSVALVLLSGPVTSNAIFSCFGGLACHVDISVAGVDSLESQEFLDSAALQVSTESCGADVIMEAMLSDSEESSDTLDDSSSDAQMKTFNQRFGFPNVVTVSAGYYVACWKPATSSPALLLGDFVVKGPVADKTPLESSSGEDIDVAVTYVGLESSDEAKAMRIQIAPIPEGRENDAFDCASLNLSEAQPYLRYTNLNRAPDTVESVSVQFSRIVWKAVSILIDNQSPNVLPGSYFAICFCNGNRGDCSVSENYFFQTNKWAVGGLSQRTLDEPLPVGRTITLTLPGKRLPLHNHLMLLPSLDRSTFAERHCGDAGGAGDGRIISATRLAHVTDWVAFKEVTITSASRTILMCWCGGDNCQTGDKFRTFVGSLSVEFPKFEATSAVIGGTFTVTLRGSVLRAQDAITVVDQSKQCGEEGTDEMDASAVEVPVGLEVTDLIQLRQARVVHADSTADSTSLSVADTSTPLVWQSWPIKTKPSVSGRLRVCYCSSEGGVCTGASRFSVWVGNVQVKGPSTGEVEIVTVDGEAKVETSGVSLALTDKLRIFAKSLAASDTVRDRRELCESGITAESTTVVADYVSPDGRTETFPVDLEPGFRYVLCWSGGTGASTQSARAKPAVTRAAPTVNLPSLYRANSGSNASTVQLAEEATAALNMLQQAASTGSATSALAPHAETETPTETWSYLDAITPTGFSTGLEFRLVQNFESEVLYIPGSPNVSHSYVAYVGQKDLQADCEEIKQNPLITMETMIHIQDDSVSFSVGRISEAGLYPVCVCDSTANECYDVGTAHVDKTYWKTVAELVYDNRFFMLPCVTRGIQASAADGQSWSEDRVWLPDGMGAWSFVLTTTDSDSKPAPVLKRTPATGSKAATWVNFYEKGLRSTVACATGSGQRIFFLGPGVVYMMDPVPGLTPDLSTATGQMFTHSVLKPVDFSVREPYIFFSDYETQVITSINIENPSLTHAFFPTDPVMLFSAGVNVMDTDENFMALCVADTFNHIVGRLNISFDTMNKPQSQVTGTPWTAYFGTPKTAQNGINGFSYPFALTSYSPQSTSETELMSLLLVTELVSDRLVFLDLSNNGLTFYKQISLSERHLISGLQSVDKTVMLISRAWPPTSKSGGMDAYVSLLNLEDVGGDLYFTYPDFRSKLQSGLFYSFEPLITGSVIQSFKEVSGSDLAKMGLTLNSATGVISGTVSHTGPFTIAVAGGDLLETFTWTISGEAGCRSGEYFDSTNNACELCPVGTFRDQEANLQKCHDIKPYSTTLSPGSTHLAQCRCFPGFEIGNLGDCHPCGAGTYKSSISDTKCTGRCPGNMHSYIQGAENEEDLLCMCDAGYYEDGGGCTPCQQGYYCPGEHSPPEPCPENHTTKGGASKSISDCVCVAGYTKQGDACVECDRLSYKGTTGNDACTGCPQPAAKGDRDALIASTKLDEAQFTTKPGAKKVSDCMLCASGFFYDVSNGGCTPCRKNYYCPGTDQEPRACVENATTLRGGAESTFDCKCPKGYGGSVARNPLDKAIVCVACPKNTFQHLDGVMTDCLPCPPFTMTKSTKSASFSACVARPGFYLSSRLSDMSRSLAESRSDDGTVGDDVDLDDNALSGTTNSGWTTSSSNSERVRKAEVQYENMSDEELLDLPRLCQRGTGLIDILLPEVKMQKYTNSFEQCIIACARNVYCTSLTFTNEGNAVPAMTASVTNHTGTFIIGYWICELHMYGPPVDQETVASITDPITETVVPASWTVSCAMQRPESDTVWRSVTYEECPVNAYCPGDEEAQIYQCPASSVTLANRASAAEHCKCIPGYHLSGRQCEPCRVGTYKNTTDNTNCAECPTGFTTENLASISAYDCACIPGLYMIANADADAEGEADHTPADGSSNSSEDSIVTHPKPDADSSDSQAPAEQTEGHAGNTNQQVDAADGETPDTTHEEASETESVSAVELRGGLLVRGDGGVLQRAFKASQNSASKRSSRALGDAIGEEQGLSFYQTTAAPWLQPDIRQELEKIVTLHPCVSCYKHMYCPGLWMDPPVNQIHMPPQHCPEGSTVPLSTALSDSVEKCLCMAGYAVVEGSTGGTHEDNAYFGCEKCAAGTYKELQENAPCAGRCMRDAETIEGAVAKIQCFCKIGKYAVVAEDAEGIITCQDCIAGGVCPGGLKTRARQAVEQDHSFVKITIDDHQVPFPSSGFYAVYKPLNETVWSPAMVPMVASFTGDTFKEFTDTGPAPDDHTDEGGANLDSTGGSGEPSSSAPVDPSGENEGQLLTGTTGAVSALQMRSRANDTSVHQYDRIPDIHPCVDDVRCRGGSHNSCVHGSAGYLCSACEEDYSEIRYKSGCQACLPLWLDSFIFILMRLVVCGIIWIITALTIIAVQQQACIHPVLIRIVMSHMFFLSVYGLMPATSQSQLAGWASIYRLFFFEFYFALHPYFKMPCFFRSLGIVMPEAHVWYWQHFFQIFVPFIDAVLLTIIGAICVATYKVMYSAYISRVLVVLEEARQAHGDDMWTEKTIRKIESERCLGMFRYIYGTSTPWENFVRLCTDLIPAYTAIWFWHFPTFVIECTMLMGCIETRYKSEDPISVLAAFPVQICSFENPYFLSGLILGGVGLLVWGVGSIAGFVAYMSGDHSSDTIEQRFKHGFLVNGYQYAYRWWEGVIGLRKTCVALIITMYVHANASGAQEIFRNSANLALTVLSTALQLQLEPFDKRSHDMANRMEFYGLMVNIIIGVIFQGSYYFEVFKYMGAIPLAVAIFYYLYVLWSLFVEWGRMVMMRPHLVSIPSLWRYYNRVTRSLARLYTSRNAKIYYNYITKDMVLEAATKSRVFHLRRLLLRRKKTSYRKINYENRTYFVAALSDSLSQLVIAWCQFTIPGDWLDFTIRYAFCYCFWQRYQDNRSLRVPLDLEEFEAVKPTLFSDWYYDSEKNDPQGEGDIDFGTEILEGGEITFNTAEQDFLDLMLDDDVYDDSPITLMELYVAVQSMQHVPQRQLRRLHLAYRERMTQAGDSTAPQLRKENHALEGELEELNRALLEMAGADENMPDLTFSPLDFFFTVEMVNQAQLEVERLRGLIESEIDDIARARAAQAVAVHLELSMNEAADVDKLLEAMETDERTTKEEEMTRIGYVEESTSRMEKKAGLAGRRARLAFADKRPPVNLDDKRRIKLGLAAGVGGAQRRRIGLVTRGAEGPPGAKRRIGRHEVEFHRTVQGLAAGAAPAAGLRSHMGTSSSLGDQLGDDRRTVRLGTNLSTPSAVGNKRTLRRDTSGASAELIVDTAPKAPAATRTLSPLLDREPPVVESEGSVGERRESPTPSRSPSGTTRTVGSVVRSVTPEPSDSVGREESGSEAPLISPSASSLASPRSLSPLTERRGSQGSDLGGRRRLGPLTGPRPPPPVGEAAPAEAPSPSPRSSSPLAAQPKGQGLPLGKRQLKKPGSPKQE